MGRRKKKKIIEKVEITGIADKGKSVGRNQEGQVVFVDKVVPGDIVDVLVLRKRKGFMQGIAQTIHKYSEDRVEPICEHFGVCGGCKWQHLSYEAQIKHKALVVHNAFRRIGKIEPEEGFSPILSAAETSYYRNKLEFSFSNRRWLTSTELSDDSLSNQQEVLGFHPPGSFDKIVDIQHCHLQGGISNELRNTMRELAIEQGLAFYDIRSRAGMLRHMIVRISSIGETMLIVSFFENDQEKIQGYLGAIQAQFPQLNSIYYCINPKMNDFMMDLEMNLFHGTPWIEEQLGEVRFRIGPKSFFQTNSLQAARLFDVVAKFADLQGTENVYDLYTGLGSIALYLAKHCRQVVGIEEIAQAIEDAKDNMALNEIDNAVFYAGDVKDILTTDFAQRHGKPDVVVTDPPRAGMHKEVIEILLELAAPKIVYVSCNPATQARDLSLLAAKYRVVKSRAVDMFPHTHHVENVALLVLKSAEV